MKIERIKSLKKTKIEEERVSDNAFQRILVTKQINKQNKPVIDWWLRRNLSINHFEIFSGLNFLISDFAQLRLVDNEFVNF